MTLEQDFGNSLKKWRRETIKGGNKKIVCLKTSLDGVPVWVTSAHADSSFCDAELLVAATEEVRLVTVFFPRSRGD
jgi:hypothetical protein